MKELINKILREEFNSLQQNVMKQENVKIRVALKHLDEFVNLLSSVNASAVDQQHFVEMVRFIKQHVQPTITEFIKQKREGSQQQGF